MAILLMVAGMLLTCVAVTWFMVIAPNKKKKALWADFAVPAAQQMGGEVVTSRYGFENLAIDGPQGRIAVFVSAGLAVESNVINRRAYRSDGSAYYANITFEGEQMPRFEVTVNGFATQRFENGEVGEFGKFFNVIADDASTFNELWTDEARELAHRWGIEWSVLCGGRQIHAVREGSPESAEEMHDMIRVVQILSERAPAMNATVEAAA